MYLDGQLKATVRGNDRTKALLEKVDLTHVRRVSVFTVRVRLHLIIQRTVLRRKFCPSVRLFVCLSDKRVHSDKTKETCAHVLIPNEMSFILVF